MADDFLRFADMRLPPSDTATCVFELPDLAPTMKSSEAGIKAPMPYFIC
eukprot:CAMPEP_0196211912 /NCGR_PEP_ID=MMETSP0912-20130531/19291_1 /TAXON_ID=49265 /ORGANISM="Thalassiosira rotula, Strain GSO102" /LENGTH=48 /DNA_ID= /DNA_START= /DNA_END= /DNA_ORIENTATION=